MPNSAKALRQCKEPSLKTNSTESVVRRTTVTGDKDAVLRTKYSHGLGHNWDITSATKHTRGEWKTSEEVSRE